MNTLKLETYVEEKWETTIALTRTSIDLVNKFAELLQYKEIEGLDIDDLIIETNKAYLPFEIEDLQLPESTGGD